jgi:hypothetical protein
MAGAVPALLGPARVTLSRVMKDLEQQGDENVRLRYVRDGAGENVFGVLVGRSVASRRRSGRTTISA